MKHLLFLFFIIIFIANLFIFPQENYKQTIRGKVINSNTETPLIGATVILMDSDPVIGTVTGIEGDFRFENIPAGRQGIKISYVGYEPVVLRNLYLHSGKELVLEIKLEEKIVYGEEIIIKAFGRKDKPINEMAQISARSFTIEETERYAGGIGDPARMASNFAGIMTLGTQVNDIVIRGNTPNGLLWRMDGLNIPNPNHFGTIGSSGGTISMINNNLLRNSDFYTGAFPAEFGNALAGVFDLNFRSGNNQKREYLAQVSFNGFELGAEGPFVKGKKASYLANYRYSSLAVFNKLGLIIGTPAIPYYQDLSLKIDMPSEKLGKFSIFGIFGDNSIEREDISDILINSFNWFSRMYFLGFNNSILLSEKSSIKTSAGYSLSRNSSWNNTVKHNFPLYRGGYKSIEKNLQFSINLKNKINSRNNIELGLNHQVMQSLFADSVYFPDYQIYINNLNLEGSLNFFQSFIQWKHKINDNLSFVTGLHYNYTKTGKDYSIEPRFSLSWDFLPKQSVSIGVGKHSQLQPRLVYFFKTLIDTANLVYIEPNKNLKLSKSNHFVLGYNYLFNENLRLKIETYYQHLYDIPVEKDSSYKSLINYGSTFSVFEYGALINGGTGRNIGTELTFEKFLSDNYYFLFTLSLFDSKYKGSDGVLRNARYNGNIICNALGGYEWSLKNQNTLAFDIKTVWADGERKIPIDLDASKIAKKTIYDITDPYKKKFKDYFRIDIRLSYKVNLKNVSHVFAIDLMNINNRNNHFIEMYDPVKEVVEEASTLKIMPSFLWRMNF